MLSRSQDSVARGQLRARKGKDSYALSFLVSWVKGLGYKRVVCRSDNEPALLALLSLMSASMPDIEFVPKTSPEGDHQANGLAEIGVREAKGQVRVLRSQLEANLGERLSEEEPILMWLPRHATNCINRYRIGNDGRTAEQRRTGRKWKRPAVTFGEKVYYRPIQKRGGARNDAEMRMKEGIFVGHHERIGAHILLTPSGTQRGVGLHRLPTD